MNLFKMFGIKKAEEIPEYVPHPDLKGEDGQPLMVRNPAYTKIKHGGLMPAGESSVGEGATIQDVGHRTKKNYY